MSIDVLVIKLFSLNENLILKLQQLLNCLYVSIISLHFNSSPWNNVPLILFSLDSPQIKKSTLSFCSLLDQDQFPHPDSQRQFGCALTALFHQLAFSYDFLCYSQICHLTAPCLQCSPPLTCALAKTACFSVERKTCWITP